MALALFDDTKEEHRSPPTSESAPSESDSYYDELASEPDIESDHMVEDEQGVDYGAAQESEIPNFKGSYLGRFPLVSADSWTSDHLSERSRSVDAFPGTRARGTLTLKRR